MSDDLMRGVKEVLCHAEYYQLAEDMYDGDVDEVFASPKMRQALGDYGENFSINFAHIPVDVIADRLEVAAITVPEDDASTSVLQEEIWDKNGCLMKAKGWTRKTCEYGDGPLFVWENDDEENPGVLMLFNNPKTTRVIYDAETESKPEFAIKLWKEGKRYRATLYYPDRFERYTTQDDGKPNEENDWYEYVEEDEDGTKLIWPTPNPYNYIPIFHLRNDEPYGFPEHKNAFNPQNIVNKIVPSHMSSIDFQAFPQRYGIKEANLVGGDEDDGLDWNESDTDASVSDQDKSKLKAGAGEFWNLEGYKSVGQFDPAQPAVFLEPLATYIRILSTVTATPLHYFDPDKGAPSGESRRAANEPTDKKAGDRQQRLGSTLSEAFSFALHIVEHRGQPVTKDSLKKVDVRWASPGTVSDMEGWQTVKLKVESGIPLRFALLENGYTAEQCDAWGVTQETTNVPMMQQIALVSALGVALQGLGAGVSLGVLSEEDVKAIVDKIVTNGIEADEGEAA